MTDVRPNLTVVGDQPAKARRKPQRMPAGLEQHRGQLRFAERFANAHLGKFMHTPGRGWFEWNGSWWQECESDARPKGAVIGLLKSALRELPNLESDDRDDLLADIRKCESDTAVKGVLGLAQAWFGIARRDDELDNKPDLFVCRNGTIDLMTDEFRPSNPADLITKVAGCDYDPEAACPTYDKSMERWQPDPDRRAYVHRIGGSALQGRSTEQTLPVWYGRGANGKGSTANDAWHTVFGDYAKVLAVQVLLSNPAGSDYLPQKASLKGARLIITSEPDAGVRFSTGTLKLLTGGDPIDACAKYKAPFKVMPTWQIIMLTNNRPEPPADDAGVWRRLRQVGWDVDVPEAEWDTQLPQKLQAEAAGILNRLLEGWRDYRDNGGIRTPLEVQRATKAWRSEVDVLGQFIEERCHVGGGDHVKVKSSELFGNWDRWCRVNGENARTQTWFTEALKKRGYEKKRSNGSWFSGIGLTSSAAERDTDDD